MYKTKLFPHSLKSIFNMSLLLHSVNLHSFLTGFFTSNHPKMLLEHYRRQGGYPHPLPGTLCYLSPAGINIPTTFLPRTFVQFSEKETFWTCWQKSLLDLPKYSILWDTFELRIMYGLKWTCGLMVQKREWILNEPQDPLPTLSTRSFCSAHRLDTHSSTKPGMVALVITAFRRQSQEGNQFDGSMRQL